MSKLLEGESGTLVRLQVVPKGSDASRVYEIRRDATSKWLDTVLQTADDDPWRNHLRLALTLADNRERLSALVSLADKVDVARQPVRALTRLASQLALLGDRELRDAAPTPRPFSTSQ